MLKRPTAAIKWVIVLSVPMGLTAFLPAASWAYAELGHFQFTPWVWLAGLQHQVDPRNLLLAGLSGGAAALGLPGLVAWMLLPPKPLHGAARLARPGEIAKARLYRAGAHSILLGRHRGRLLAFNGNLHPSWPQPRAPARAWGSWCRTCCTGRGRPDCAPTRERDHRPGRWGAPDYG